MFNIAGGHRHLHPGQLVPEAVVDAVTEGQVRTGNPPDVEHVGVGEEVRVPVRRRRWMSFQGVTSGVWQYR
ncbi:hypothetical protein ACTXG6_16970 [Pseudonocardia sp. Cha107L01]|uniref:hypothetical protein n=1 Tax=Pseudonocardia sp. Cha107L01 TaxID=3457576 RepID=UPI00403EE1AF